MNLLFLILVIAFCWFAADVVALLLFRALARFNHRRALKFNRNDP